LSSLQGEEEEEETVCFCFCLLRKREREWNSYKKRALGAAAAANRSQSLAGAVPPFSIYLHKYPSCSRGKQLHVYWDSCGERRTHEVSRADETLKPTEEANSNSFNKEKEIRKKELFHPATSFPL
jgi:hypothetical protein